MRFWRTSARTLRGVFSTNCFTTLLLATCTFDFQYSSLWIQAPAHGQAPAKKVWAGHALSHDNNAEYYRPETEKVWQICSFVILGILSLCRHSRVGWMMKRCENDLKMVPDPCEELRQPGISTLCSAVSWVRVDCLDWSASPKLYILRRHMYLSLFTNINLRHQWKYSAIKKRLF